VRLRFVAVLPVGLLLACAPAIQSTGTEPVVAERIYFGRNIGDTLAVTDSAWTVFVTDVVSARLPAGFTFWKAEGQWRGADGRPRREPSYVLEVVHPPRAAETDAAIRAIIAEYKRRFGQEAVLRVVTVGRAAH
jgi:Protein of unknown function (DUF3574)